MYKIELDAICARRNYHGYHAPKLVLPLTEPITAGALKVLMKESAVSDLEPYGLDVDELEKAIDSMILTESKDPEFQLFKDELTNCTDGDLFLFFVIKYKR